MSPNKPTPTGNDKNESTDQKWSNYDPPYRKLFMDLMAEYEKNGKNLGAMVDNMNKEKELLNKRKKEKAKLEKEIEDLSLAIKQHSSIQKTLKDKCDTYGEAVGKIIDSIVLEMDSDDEDEGTESDDDAADRHEHQNFPRETVRGHSPNDIEKEDDEIDQDDEIEKEDDEIEKEDN